MIDLHTHLLPGIDDGARDREEAMKIIDALYDQKITAAVCTPHFDPTQIALKDFLKQREGSMNQLEGAKIQLIPASETMLHDYLFHYPDLSDLCIKDTKYLLLELSFGKKWPKETFELIHQLIIYRNIIPVIAHIERYPAIRRHNSYIRRLIKLGCVIQGNSSAFIEYKSRRRMFSYLKKDYIDVLSSDVHNLTNRKAYMQLAFQKVEKKFGQDRCEILEQNAEHIVKGIELRTKKSYFIE